ncbi:MAG: DNA mismatch repair endonuclease MutL, partial [Clostridiaceae bacterium]|nr:DNA mismatch repair endonuclease MutL [Clostridiaceae bacterium]
MGKIHVLDESTINKIAAGEVIERPASIVKELVENSIDAGAAAISIEILEGGKSLITVSDNGCGIMKEDTEQVFFRHATSKIKDSGDIQGINTLGFRGEAMASIAAVSEVELLTKAEGDTSGSHIIIKGGKPVQNVSIGYPTGTSVTVRDLFFNTPARLKFLKSDSSEQGAIVDIVEKLAMTNTGISMKLTVNNKVVLHTPGNGDLLSVILCIYGKSISGAMLLLEYSNDNLSIEGYIGKPEIARGNSTYMTFSVNKRYIKSRMLSEAVKQAYKT